MFDKENYYFRVKYQKLKTDLKLSNGLRSDIKFESDNENNYVFSLYPELENLSEELIVGNEWEALDEGTAIIHKPIYDDKDGYFEMIRDRVKVGKKHFLLLVLIVLRN